MSLEWTVVPPDGGRALPIEGITVDPYWSCPPRMGSEYRDRRGPAYRNYKNAELPALIEKVVTKGDEDILFRVNTAYWLLQWYWAGADIHASY